MQTFSWAHIFEHGNQPGGVSATWKRKGYTIDGGIHFYNKSFETTKA